MRKMEVKTRFQQPQCGQRRYQSAMSRARRGVAEKEIEIAGVPRSLMHCKHFSHEQTFRWLIRNCPRQIVKLRQLYPMDFKETADVCIDVLQTRVDDRKKLMAIVFIARLFLTETVSDHPFTSIHDAGEDRRCQERLKWFQGWSQTRCFSQVGLGI